MSDKKQDNIIQGFSRLDKEAKLRWVAEQHSQDPEALQHDLEGFWHPNKDLQQTLDGFSENTISNFALPFGVAPNFLIDDQVYTIPMVIEESSVVAAASSAAKFWLVRGGFHTEVIDTLKLGQVHLEYLGDKTEFINEFQNLEPLLRAEAAHLTQSMEARGGGIREIELLEMPEVSPNYFQLRASFETCDSMGANFINSVLEQFAATLEQHYQAEQSLLVIMSILSNYTPDCLVRAWVECPVEQLEGACGGELNGPEFADRFAMAVWIARQDTYRAVTHNKGIFNGIDAVVLATANDFRAIEACGHAYAARDGQYRSLSSCQVENGIFRFELEIPLALGTVGGLTKLHPLARRSLEILGEPNAQQLMRIIAATGLAQNFAAVKSLITTGIQKGHMKMHLQNILSHLKADAQEREAATQFFAEQTVSFNAVRHFLEQHRTPTH